MCLGVSIPFWAVTPPPLTHEPLNIDIRNIRQYFNVYHHHSMYIERNR